MSAKRFQQRVYCRPKLTPLEEVSIGEEGAAYRAATAAAQRAELSPWREVEQIAERLSPLIERDGPDRDLDRLRELAREHGGDAEVTGMAMRSGHE